MSLATHQILYTYDAEADNWGFRVPDLHIVGAGDTRQDAADRAEKAIAYALSTDDRSVHRLLYLGLGAIGALAIALLAKSSKAFRSTH